MSSDHRWDNKPIRTLILNLSCTTILSKIGGVEGHIDREEECDGSKFREIKSLLLVLGVVANMHMLLRPV